MISADCDALLGLNIEMRALVLIFVALSTGEESIIAKKKQRTLLHNNFYFY